MQYPVASVMLAQWAESVSRTAEFDLKKERRRERTRYTHFVTIDEQGMGYCHPAISIEDAIRHAKKLREEGYRVRIQ